MTRPWKKGRTYYARVPRSTGPAVPRALGTRSAPVVSPDVARAIQRMLDALVARGEWAVLDAMAAGHVAPVRVLAAWRAHDLAGLLARLHDVELRDLVARWPAASEKARRQVVRLVGDGWRRSAFTAPEVVRRLADLGVGQPNRYHAALSSFARWLVQTGVLASNPVRDVARAREAPPVVRALAPEDVGRVLAAITDPEDRARAALMAATGLELQATARLRHRDVEEDRLDARGTKTMHRTRTVVLLLREYAGPWLAWYRRGLPDAPVFARGVRAFQAGVTRAASAVGVTMRPAHDWRHTLAVTALRRGVSAQVVAHQLGHGSTALTLRVYGRYVPSIAELHSATERATGVPETPRRHHA